MQGGERDYGRMRAGDAQLAVSRVLSAAGRVLIALRHDPVSFSRAWPGASRRRRKAQVSEEKRWAAANRTTHVEALSKESERVLRAPDRSALRRYRLVGFLGAGTYGTVVSAVGRDDRFAYALKYVGYSSGSVFNAENEFEMQRKMANNNPPLAFEATAIVNPRAAASPRRLQYWLQHSRALAESPTPRLLVGALRDFFTVIVMRRMDATLDRLIALTPLDIGKAPPASLGFLLPGEGDAAVRGSAPPASDGGGSVPVGAMLQELLAAMAAARAVHADLKVNNVGCVVDGRGELSVRFIDWGKAFDADVLEGLGAPPDEANRICTLGHVLDASSLLMSVIRLGRRSSGAQQSCAEATAMVLHRYFLRVHSALRLADSFSAPVEAGAPHGPTPPASRFLGAVHDLLAPVRVDIQSSVATALDKIILGHQREESAASPPSPRARGPATLSATSPPPKDGEGEMRDHKEEIGP
jgi:hypothetical protein